MTEDSTTNGADAHAGSHAGRWLGLAAAGLGLVAVGAGLVWWSPWDGGEAAATRIGVTGDIRTHDPALVVGDEGEDWYVYSTGDVRVGLGAPQIRRSSDAGETWEMVGTAWDAQTRPEWVYEEVPGVQNFWAPELYEHDGTWYLYYSASTFGSNRSLIGLMTSPTLDVDDPAYGWTDQGEVWRSTPGETNYNAIDAGIVEDEDGTPWMAFGSFWGGIQMVELEWPSGKAAAGTEPISLATRNDSLNAIEAPYVFERDGWYYLFVSRDKCCSGLDSTYSIAVGRSESVTGPYLDSLGNDMRYNGGDVVLSSRGDMVGPGGQSLSHGYLGLHFYDASLGGEFRLDIRDLAWTEDGWPVAWTAEELEDS
ncbi:arabinan endo-1,5-alpha-L-arabinosidase [Demequina sp. NBRC 110056]|uniref:arabinan endo-1,5-alpha-L-arabinosidase n=1 Tax=Demequina sp. NBRC 110056 TaxID=1570345 RepID=UPI000A047157|nr:arabinan endo-1,5-alpha-L-arabinosidase [Demequina sp. NBRC 110056]